MLHRALRKPLGLLRNSLTLIRKTSLFENRPLLTRQIMCTGKEPVRQFMHIGNSAGKSQNVLCFSSGTKGIYRTNNANYMYPRMVIVRYMARRAGPGADSSVAVYVVAVFVAMVGLAYAGVPLYRMFCQATGLGGTVSADINGAKLSSMLAIQERKIKVCFNADTASSMQWKFRPQQTEIMLSPGETALAFYKAKNPTDQPIIGISTYNVIPFEAGQYFNKIQCFCFEEQRLNPHEEVDMPVFFYIDPEFAEDPQMEDIESITLSYTFFEAKEGFKLPLPGYS